MYICSKINQKNSAYWCFCENTNTQYVDFFNSVLEYTNFLKQTNLEERVLSPLICVVNFDGKTLAENQAYAWQLIQYLLDNDKEPWLENIPTDTNHFKWCLCFNGVQLFVNISSAKHQYLKSRNLNTNLCLIINPREVFDLVAPIDRQKGLNIRRIIRNRICVFNKSQKYPSELGFFGDINNLEWRQYQLYEEGGLVIDTCPIKMHKERIDV